MALKRGWIKPDLIPTLDWLPKYFRLPPEGSDIPGPYNPDYVPYLWGIFNALDNPDIKIVVMQKAAQVGWTFGLIGYLSRLIHLAPTAMLIIFPKEGTGKEFNDEKFVPSVRATPVLSNLIDVSGSRKTGQRAGFKTFVGGFLKLVGSNSVSNVKSTPAPLVIVEEPDDTNDSVGDQGDAIRLARERLKRFRNGKLILGGTPSVKGISRVEEFINLSDKRVLPIECHECGNLHSLDWNHVSWLERDCGAEHPVYGMADPDSAIYSCPDCGSVWDDYRRKENVKNTVLKAQEAGDPYCGWEATAETSGDVVGFTELNELYVCMPGTSLADVVRDYLEAEHEAANGDESGRIVFTNSKLARPYEYKTDSADDESLRAVALDYPELVIQGGGLLITAGVDVQHNRLAIIIRAWGRNEESWLLYWGEIFAESTCLDKNDAVWSALDKALFSTINHENGRQMTVSAISIDGSDGNSNDAVYDWVRSRSRKHRHVQIMAVKGSSSQQDPEIFSTPRSKSVDHRRPDKQTKADRHGLKVYIVGTNKGKDWLAGQQKLEATGRGRWHFYTGVRADYFKQITAEVKAPHKSSRFRRVWQQKSGRRNEATDCEDYALHAARALRVHLLRPHQWDELEQQLVQADLFQNEVASTPALASRTKKKRKSLAELAAQMNG